MSITEVTNHCLVIGQTGIHRESQLTRLETHEEKSEGREA
jgi:hypothetical protein